jgi:hypothetical protein
MRSIGSACHSLVYIDVSHAKMVTDVGVASMSSGCPALRHVKFQGVSSCYLRLLLSTP